MPNSSANQSDNAFPAGFDALLQQLSGRAGVTPEALPLAPLEGLAQLQSMPAAGNFLPLLQQLVARDAPVGSGDAARAGGLSGDAGTDDAPLVLESLDQILAELTGASPAQAVAEPAQPLSLPGRDRSLSGIESGLPETARRQIVQNLEQLRLAIAGNAETGKPPAELVQDRPDLGHMRVMESGYPPPSEAPAQRSAEVLAALAGLRQAASAPKAAVQSSPAGAESVSAVPVQNAVQPPAAAPQALPTLSLDVPFQQADWDQALGERIQWLAGKQLQGAQIKLNPAHLGPMEVRIQVQNDQASIQFSSAHAVVREALESALPRLRDMFEAAGVQLLDVDVSGESSAQQRHASDEPVANGLKGIGGTPEEGAETLLEVPVVGRVLSGRLDLFA
jgi:flagellar hook-length control protein FliK